MVVVSTKDMTDKQVTLRPDDDFRRAITKDELLNGIYEDISKRLKKNESAFLTRNAGMF